MTQKKMVLRLTAYKRALLKMRMLGFQKVFSDNLAEATGVSSALVRKDFSILKIPGKRRGGYEIRELLSHLNRILGEYGQESVILVGAGNLGAALMRHRAFQGEKIKIIAAFDSDPKRISRENDLQILPMDELSAFVKKNKIRIAILAVPEEGARDAFETLTSAGLEGVMNFAPVTLPSSESCVVNNINLGLELEAVLYYVINKEAPGNGK